ncbi:YqiJ family protein [Myxococcus sp. K38C18041901]|uniref:YqiJ family protein n=1 Tax=Myxococcus guangdongensis TaxID=2906760 RepID=UPI0020A7371F|nr:YqiJ family protein [Myxococcus guangdongensis]MCP3060324.1 YqiJ family protein [Myxococcus guangdongensis]
MTPFFDAILAFPTAIFTTAMGVVLTYWLFVIVGAVGIDLLDGGHVDFESGGKALGAALEGGGKALAGSLEGGAKAAGEALQGGKALAGHDHDAHVDSGILSTLGFAGIPLTVSVSLVSFFSWFLSLMATPPAHALLGGALPSWLINSTLGILCFIAGLVISGFAVRPLRPVFVAHKAPGRDSLLGRVCTISSGTVTDKNGHATFEDGGAGIILNVICAKANGLKRGDPALVLSYDAQRDAYEVEPVDWLLPEEMDQLRDPVRAAALARSRART